MFQRITMLRQLKNIFDEYPYDVQRLDKIVEWAENVYRVFIFSRVIHILEDYCHCQGSFVKCMVCRAKEEIQKELRNGA